MEGAPPRSESADRLVSLAVVQADVDLDLAPGAEDVVFERRGRVRSDRQALLALTA